MINYEIALIFLQNLSSALHDCLFLSKNKSHLFKPRYEENMFRESGDRNVVRSFNSVPLLGILRTCCRKKDSMALE